MVFAAGAAVSLVAALIDAVTIQTALAPAADLLSDDLRREVWWDWFEIVVPMVVLPALAAVSARAAASSDDTDRRGGWTLFAGSCVWAVGAAVVGDLVAAVTEVKPIDVVAETAEEPVATLPAGEVVVT